MSERSNPRPRGVCPYDDQPACIMTFSAESATIAQCAEFVAALREALQGDVRDGKLARAHVDGWGSWKLASLPRYENCLGYDTEGPYRFIHAIRDPLEVVLSGYQYHLKTTERWANRVERRYNGTTYRRYLNAISQTDGLQVSLSGRVPERKGVSRVLK